ncbi:MAG: tyrosine-type recombinase/integrase [Actinomycetota bacterium]
MPFFLEDDGTPVRPVNRWLRSLPTTGAPAPTSWAAYAGDLGAWIRFVSDRSLHAIDEPSALAEAVAAYHAHRRMGDRARRLSPASWNRAVTSISRFYEWAETEGLINRVPFSYRLWTTRGGGSGPRTVRRNMAKERQPRSHVSIRWLEQEYLELFLEVGLGGMLPGEGDDPRFRGREAARNAAVGHLASSSGLRAQEFSHLLVWEVPPVPADPETPVVPLVVPGVIAKGDKARTTWVSPTALRHVHTYVGLERALAVKGSPWRPAGEALHVTDPTPIGGRVNGRKVRWAALDLDQRRRLVAPGGGSAQLAVTVRDAPVTDWEYVFASASARCRRFRPGFPHVTPHTLRHTFAVHTLRWLVRTHMASVAKLLEVASADPAWVLALRSQDPLMVLRDLLGHASVSTTETYLRLIDTTRLFTDAELGVGEEGT